jgi:hypothetical protein
LKSIHLKAVQEAPMSKHVMVTGVSQKGSAPLWYRWFQFSDYVTLFHLPFSALVLSFVIIGSSLATTIFASRAVMSMLAVFFSVQGGHYLDEIKGRPWGTSISKLMLYVVGLAFVACGAAIGVYLSLTVSLLLLPFLIPVVLFPIAYSLELWNERFHSPFWFGLSWGFFVCLGSSFVQTLTITPSSFLVAAAVGVMGNHILLLYEGTKAAETREICWSTLKGIVFISIVIAIALIELRLSDVVWD